VTTHPYEALLSRRCPVCSVVCFLRVGAYYRDPDDEERWLVAPRCCSGQCLDTWLARRRGLPDPALREPSRPSWWARVVARLA